MLETDDIGGSNVVSRTVSCLYIRASYIDCIIIIPIIHFECHYDIRKNFQMAFTKFSKYHHSPFKICKRDFGNQNCIH